MTERKSRRGTEVRARHRLVNLRLTPEEEADLRNRAAAFGIPVATYMRRKVFSDDTPTR